MKVLYVGWTGKQNLGDDAIADALVPHVPGIEPWHVPHDPLGFARKALAEGPFGRGRRTVLLGGGTVIGRRNWRLLLTATGVALASARPWHLIGAGVEDPAFQGQNSFSANGELSRWRSVCARFDRVTVRGPRSKALLDSVGIDARVVGDPALLHEAAAVSPRERLVGVNLGFGDDLWGHDHDRVVAATAELVRELVTDGWTARLIVINPKDLGYARDCLRLAGIPDERADIVTTLTVPDFLAAAGECTVLVAERLHALVLGAVAGTPLAGLEYQPKCADFLESVGAWGVRTDAVTGDGLRERVDELAEHRDTESRRLLDAVAALRGPLRAELAHIQASVSGELEVAT